MNSGMKNIKKTILGAILAFAFLLSIAVLTPELASAAASDDIQCGVNAAAGADGCAPDPDASATLDSTVKSVINILSILVGVFAVVMILVAGFRYITSGGDSAKVTSAKNTLVYAIIGLIIAALAQVIVKFVLKETINPTVPGSSSQPSGAPSTPSDPPGGV